MEKIKNKIASEPLTTDGKSPRLSDTPAMFSPRPPIDPRIMTLGDFVQTFTPCIPASRMESFRTISKEDRRLTHNVKGQPHFGNIIPIITDGIHVYAVLVENPKTFIIIHATNLIKVKPSPDTSRHTTKSPSKPKKLRRASDPFFLAQLLGEGSPE